MQSLNFGQKKGVRKSRKGGFTLLEVAIAVTIVGLLAAGGVLMVKSHVEDRLRDETTKYLREVRQALLVYAKVKKKLPFPSKTAAEVESGIEGTSWGWGYLPYQTLGVAPKDPYGNSIKYTVTRYQDATRCVGSTSFAAWIRGSAAIAKDYWPEVVDGGNSKYEKMVVAAVILSPGPNHVFDKLYFSSGGYVDNNYNLNTNDVYARHEPKPSDNFDDNVTYIGLPSLYENLCSTYSSP